MVRVTAPCGVTGDYTPDPLAAVLGHRTQYPPCALPGTELVRFRCERGHERERWSCPAHVDVLVRPRPDERSYCIVCWETDQVESALTPLVDVPDRPPAVQPWREGGWSV